MKASRSRIANAIARNAKIKGGPPKVSKYASKHRPIPTQGKEQDQ